MVLRLLAEEEGLGMWLSLRLGVVLLVVFALLFLDSVNNGISLTV
tara:strand:- start:528 stop:662 length:135 start_codon:yes stop_codon:yes gene_type:complete